MPSFGQGPSTQALAQQQQAMQFMPPQAQTLTKFSVCSILGGVQDDFLNESLSEGGGTGKPDKATVFSQEEEEEEEATKRRKVPLVKLDFSVAETGEKLKERLENIRQLVPHDKESLFKANSL
ncbi:hypothetical protein K435DRAFT_861114 [Dendrothele bispora CBS 962.96]|uniref:Uncharacterized protein n=1 Tax=Dendrothele bispora (strain CBS 962.96) TaxID=1314807 RepID=A0A4S8LXD5_DENBC|nr:hypothetical protein K435DRAFT_861114 [Dendrothele bispora CBS 962.96]